MNTGSGEAVGKRISTSKSEATALRWKTVDCFLSVESKNSSILGSCSQVREKLDQREDWCSISNNAGGVPDS